MTGLGRATAPLDAADLVVVGAGVVGLGAALRAADAGLDVVVVERDAAARGASVRNFGHGCVTAQDGEALRLARATRELWVRLAREAGFWLAESGAVVAARHDDEMAVLADLAAARADEVALLDGAAVEEAAGCPGAVGGARLSSDVRVSPREAVPALAALLARRGVRFHWRTAVVGVDERGVETSRGRVDAARQVVAVGHDVDLLDAGLAEEAGVVRCALRMLRVRDPRRAPSPAAAGGRALPALLTGWSLLRYDAFAVSPALGAVRERLARERPDALAVGLHLMCTQRPDGDLVVGDTHAYGDAPSPFRPEDLDDLLLDEVAALLGTDRPRVVERWEGVYASAPRPFLVSAPRPSTRVVSVTAGIGMTTGLGLAAEAVDQLAS